MRIQGQGSLAMLHSLAVLYLGLAQGADDDLDPAETQEVAARLREWQPGKDPAVIDHVIRDISLSYEEDTRKDQVYEAVHTLGESLSPSLRESILQDLSDIARADGRVLSEEKDFIHRVAELWSVNDQGDTERHMA